MRQAPTQPVLDDGRYRTALAAEKPPRRPMFTALTPEGVVWPDDTRTPVDAVVFATGYRPHLPYLAGTGALTDTGAPRHRQGVSTTHPGLGFLGLEWQRTPASNSLRGVGRDAAYLVRRLRPAMARAICRCCARTRTARSTPWSPRPRLGHGDRDAEPVA